MDEAQHEAIRQNLLAMQQSRSTRGKVLYEEGGLGTCGAAEGEILPGVDGMGIFDDPALLISEQHSIFIPIHRVIRVEYLPR